MTEPTDTVEEITENEAPETAPESVEPEVAPQADPEPASKSVDDLWDSFDLTAKLTDSNEEVPPTDDATAPEASFPSEEQPVDADDAEPSELNDEEILGLDLDRPAPLSRRKAEKVVKSLIEPLRDPNTPIEDVLSALTEFHPTRTQQLAEAIVSESAKAYPDEWLKSITGLDLTVDQIKELAVQGGSSPSNTAPSTATETPTDSPEMKQLVEELTELYGDDWRNPEKDAELLDADRAVVLAVRSHLAKDEHIAGIQKKLEEYESKLGEIKPQVDTIANAQTAELEQAMIAAYNNEVEAYRQKVESNSIPKILEAKNLVPKESDTPEMKAAKELLSSRFKPVEGYGSDFDIFLEKQFSGRESMMKAMNRVGNYLAEAAKLESTATRMSNPSEADFARQKASALKEQAVLEQDALTVWTRKAATEFLDSPYVKPILTILEQNAELQRRLNKTGRSEIIGQTATTGGPSGLQARIQEAKQSGQNPFDLDISDLLGGR